MDIQGFIKALYSDWVSFMGGIFSIVFAAMGFIKNEKFAFLTKPETQRRIFWFMALICFLGASVSAWTNEHKKVIALEGTLKSEQQVLKIKDALASFLSEAVAIQNFCSGVGVDQAPNKTARQLYADWHGRLGAYIKKEIGLVERDQFVDSLTVRVPFPSWLKKENLDAWILVEQSKVRLRELIARTNK